MKKLIISAACIAVAACSSDSNRSESELMELAVTAIEAETASPSITITESYFGMNNGGLRALCGTATSVLGGSEKFVVMFANGGEDAEVGSEVAEGATWSVFCDDVAKRRYVESQ